MNIFQITLGIHIEIHKIFAFFNGWVIYGWNSENKPENQDKKTRKKLSSRISLRRSWTKSKISHSHSPKNLESVFYSWKYALFFTWQYNIYLCYNNLRLAMQTFSIIFFYKSRPRQDESIIHFMLNTRRLKLNTTFKFSKSRKATGKYFY